MVKRASISSSNVAAVPPSPIKVPRLSDDAPAFAATEAPPEKVDHLLQACQPALSALRGSAKHSVDISGNEMLCTALPFALRAAQGIEVRHSYQERMLDAVKEQLLGAMSGQKTSVEAIEKELAELEMEKAQSTSKKEAFSIRLAQKKEEAHAAQEDQQTKVQALEDARVAEEAAKILSDAADGERKALEQDCDDFAAALADNWKPLKMSEFPGSQWRKRDIALKKVSDMFEKIGAEEPLVVAIQIALKIHEKNRSEFAQVTVAHGEDVCNKHSEILKEKVENFGQQMSTRAVAVAEAKVGVTVASREKDAAQDRCNRAQNLWAEETSLEANHRAKMDAFVPRTKQLRASLAEAQAKLAHYEQVYVGFEALRPVSASLRKAAGPGEAVEEKRVEEKAPEKAPEKTPEEEATL